MKYDLQQFDESWLMVLCDNGVLKYNMWYQFYYFCREELDFAYQIDGTTDNDHIKIENLHVLAQQQEHVLALCKEQADASSKSEDFEGRYKLQVFHSLFGITVRAAKLTCKTLIVNTELMSVSDLMQ